MPSPEAPTAREPEADCRRRSKLADRVRPGINPPPYVGGYASFKFPEVERKDESLMVYLSPLSLYASAR